MSRRLRGSRILNPLVVLAVATLLAACATGASSAPSTGAIEATGAWARPSMGMERAVAVYVTLRNETGAADALVAVVYEGAEAAELHETTPDASGAMAMHPVERIELPVGTDVKLEPGGLHIMLIDLHQPLMAGAVVDLTLEFEHAPDLALTAEVRES
jgi:copper(I)-binding protein